MTWTLADIRLKVTNNKLIQLFYKGHFFFVLGKGQIAKVTDMFDERVSEVKDAF